MSDQILMPAATAEAILALMDHTVKATHMFGEGYLVMLATLEAQQPERNAELQQYRKAVEETIAWFATLEESGKPLLEALRLQTALARSMSVQGSDRVQ